MPPVSSTNVVARRFPSGLYASAPTASAGSPSAAEAALQDAVLAANGLDAASLEALLYEIAEDPALAEAYATH